MARSSRSSVRLWSAAFKYLSSAHGIARSHPVVLGGTAIAPTHVNARRKSKQVVGGGDTNSGGIGCRYWAGALAQLCWSTVRLTVLANGKGIKLLRSTLSMLTGFAVLSVHQQLGTVGSTIGSRATRTGAYSVKVLWRWRRRRMPVKAYYSQKEPNSDAVIWRFMDL